MQAEDRPIHFSTELLHAPMPPRVPALQKLYYDLSQTRSGAYDSSDFSSPGQVRFYSRRGVATSGMPQPESVLLFLPDRIVLIEEWVDIPQSAFLDRVEIVGGQALATLGLPGFLGQTATIRTTFGLTHFEDARVFLLDHLCGLAGRLSPNFGRPLGVGGLRFVFPQTPEHPGELHVTIESFRFSLKEVFVEVKGVYLQKHIGPDSLQLAFEPLRRVRSFITDCIYPFLNSYDRIEETPS